MSAAHTERISRPASKSRAKNGSYDSLVEPTPVMNMTVAATFEGGELRRGVYLFTESRKRAELSSRTPRGYPRM
jgi:hypothetical protein